MTDSESQPPSWRVFRSPKYFVAFNQIAWGTFGRSWLTSCENDALRQRPSLRTDLNGAQSLAGDSGSVVYDGKGVAVGLFFRGAGSLKTPPWRFVSPIEDVLEDIKKVGGFRDVKFRWS